MSEISEPSSDTTVKPDDGFIPRILIIMTILLVGSVIASLFWADRRVTGGLIMGGLLSFVNFYWLKASLANMLGLAAAGATEPRVLTFLKYNLRFLALIMAIIAVYLSGAVSMIAFFGGLLSLAAALMVEGFIRLFLAVFRREEF